MASPQIGTVTARRRSKRASKADERRARALAKAAKIARERERKAAERKAKKAEAARKARAAKKAREEDKRRAGRSATPTRAPASTSAPVTSSEALTSSVPPSSSAPASSSAPSSGAPSTLRPQDDDGAAVEYDSQADFASHQMEQDRPVTEFRQTPQYAVNLGVSGRKLTFPDGADFKMWVFDNDASGRGFPGPSLRPKENEVFHATVEPSLGPHTVHWHGMEPDPRNDGVGHTSFEIDDVYTYQWRAEPGRAGDPNYGAAGTYFYHCHVNTPLHAQMGLLGPLIVDPVVLPEFPVPAGMRRAFADGPLYDIATESLIMPYSVDPRWHELGHAAGLSGEDVGLNRFEPTNFYITGGLLDGRVEEDEAVWAPDQLPINIEREGRAPSLMRLLDGNYLPNKIKFKGPDGKYARIAELIAHDGRPYRDTSDPLGPSIPTSMLEDQANRLTTHVVAMGAAERYDILLHPEVPGEYVMSIEWHHWITGAVLGTRTLKLIAS